MERSTEIYEGRNENVELYDWKAQRSTKGRSESVELYDRKA